MPGPPRCSVRALVRERGLRMAHSPGSYVRVRVRTGVRTCEYASDGRASTRVRGGGRKRAPADAERTAAVTAPAMTAPWRRREAGRLKPKRRRRKTKEMLPCGRPPARRGGVRDDRSAQFRSRRAAYSVVPLPECLSVRSGGAPTSPPECML